MADPIQNLITDLKRTLDDLGQRVAALKGPLNIESKTARVAELDEIMQAPDFWNDQEKASATQQERQQAQGLIDRWRQAHSSTTDLSELLEMAEGDEETLNELKGEVASLEALVGDMELARMLDGEHDGNNAILELNVGQGGVDAADFTEMLLRMYTRYAERRGYSVELLDKAPAEEAGLKNASILVKGENAYGYLKAEQGVHRLVRISPFDGNARRQTSFSAVSVLPEIDDSIEVDIKKDDLEIQTMRAGGAGGQHVNKTESAVRIKHVPTDIVVVCRQERSQHKNRETAMKMLKAKIFEHEMKKQLAEKDKAEAAKMEASFGSQIRNYVLAPYRLAKDLRSGYEVGNVDAVLDGDIQPFIEAYLLHQSAEKEKAGEA
jgi:peptide chain release factor 2